MKGRFDSEEQERVEARLRRERQQQEYHEQIRKVELRFADLSLQLQRAVQDAKLEAEYTNRAYTIPGEEWEAVVAALDAIDKYAREVAFGKRDA